MSVQQININSTRSVAQQENRKLLSVKQYSDCVEKTYLVPAKTSDQKMTPVLYSALCPGLGQKYNGEPAKMQKIFGINILSSFISLGGFGLAALAAKQKSIKKVLPAFAMMGIGFISMAATWIYNVLDAYKNAKTEVVEITHNK